MLPDSARQEQKRIFMKLCFHKRRYIHFLTAALIAVIALPGVAAEVAGQNILVVSSYNASNRWNNEVTTGLRRTLGKNSDALSVDFLELNIAGTRKLTPRPREIEALQYLLKTIHYDLVIAQGNPAADLFFDRIKLPPETPLLIFNYHCFNVNNRCQGPCMTGMTMPNAPLDNLRLGFKLLPSTRKAAVILDGGADGLSIEKCILEVKWPEGTPEIELISGRDYSTAEMLRKLSELPKDSFVVFNSWQSAREEEISQLEKLFPQIQERYSGPIFGTCAFMLDFGILGGVMVDGIQHGTEAAHLADRVLDGETPHAIPVTMGGSQLIFNDPQLKAHRIPLSRLPENAQIRNVPVPWYETYQYELLWGAVAFGALMLLSLIWSRCARRGEKRLKVIFDALPANIAVVDETGKFLFSRLHFSDGKDKVCHVNDLPDGRGEEYLAIARSVLGTDRKQIYSYDFMGRRRQAEVRSLPKHLFGRPAMLWISVDVEELHTVSERFRLTLASIGDAVIATDADEIIRTVNPVAIRLCGLSEKEMTGRKADEVLKLVHYPSGEAVESPLRAALRENRTVELANHTDLLSADGQRYHVADSAAPIRNEKREVIGAVVVFRDVTEDYRRQTLLQDALTSLNYASELTRSASFRMNIKTREITGSKMLPEVWLIRDGRAVPREEFVYPEDLPGFYHITEQLYNRKCEISTWDYRSDQLGELRYYRMRASVDWSNPDDPFLIGVMQDVTEITRNTGKLKETMELWEKVINSIPIRFFAKDANDDFRYVLCNQAFADFHNKRRDEIIGHTDAELFAGSPNADRFRQKDMEIMAEPDGESFEETVTDGRGNSTECQTVKKPFFGINGRKLLLGAFNDVSRLKRLIAREQFSNDILKFAVGEPDAERVQEYMAENLQQRMNGDRIVLFRCNEAGKLRLWKEWMPECNRFGKREVECGNEWECCLDTIRANGVVKISDLRKDEAFELLSKFCDERTKSIILVPVFIEEELWGALSVSYFTQRNLADADEGIMRSCANVISLAQIRSRQEHRIKQHEHEMQLILDNINIPISLHAADGKLLQVNAAVCRMTGKSTAELLAQPENEVFYLNVLPPADSPLKQIMAGEKTAVADLKAGSRQYLIHADAVINEQNKLVNIVKSAVDVTDVNALLRDQQMINSCLETLFQEEEVSRAVEKLLEIACAYFGATRCYVLGFDLRRRASRIFAEYALPGIRPMFEKDVDVPMSPEDESWVGFLKRRESALIYDLRDPEKATLMGSWKRMVPLFDMRSLFVAPICPHDELWGDFGVIYEKEPCRKFNERELRILEAMAHLLEVILERQESRERLVQAMEQAQAADRAKSYFIASVSHEIRTPLNSVIGFSELLKSGVLSPAEQKEYLENVVYSGNALLQLVNDVLDLSKLEAGQMQFILTPVDFAELGNEVMKVFSFRALERKLELKVEIQSMPMLELDKQRVRQILFNLIGNAVKFTDSGSITLRGEFRKRNDCSGTLEFTVSDTGIGIPPEDQKRLMEPFVQLLNMRGTNAANNGTGLGLAISKRLAENMGGKLWLRSEPGQGSTFGVTLEEIKICAGSGQLPQIDGAEPEDANQTGLAGLSLLVVDDVKLNLRVLCAMCVRAGIKNIVAVDSGAEALAELEKRSFDLVLTDMWMPEMGGRELLDKIRSDRRFDEMPVVAVTADTEARDNIDFSAVLLKPITLDKIRQILTLAKGQK